MVTEKQNNRRREIKHQVVYLVKPPKTQPQTPREADVENSAPVRVTAHGVLWVSQDTPLAKKLEFPKVVVERVKTPILSSTGAVVARRAAGAGTIIVRPSVNRPESSGVRPNDSTPPARPNDSTPTTRPNDASPATIPSTHPAVAVAAWDFGSPDLFSNYTDWIKSQDDVKFNQEEVAKIRALNNAKLEDLQKTADRLKELVKAGSDAPKDLQVAESALLQARLQAEKDLFEAEQALRVVQKTQSSLERQLIAADVPPDMLLNATEGTVIVAADVPESRVPLIQVGKACQARFYGLSDVTFYGTIGRIGSVLVKDRRTLRVLFVIQDKENRLHSNMFAEVGLGTDERDAIVVPVNALLHDGTSDYVLVASKTIANSYIATEVVVGGSVGGTGVEILKDPKDRRPPNVDDVIISTGAILLKPYVVQSLEEVK